jgi:hypothetical protein
MLKQTVKASSCYLDEKFYTYKSSLTRINKNDLFGMHLTMSEAEHLDR